jgi:hypothetical protein
MAPVRPEQARGPLRGTRAALFALAALLLAATAHLAGGGSLPPFPALALIVVPLAWGAVALTSRRRGRASVLAALAVSQLVLHQAFMALAGPTCAGAAAAAPMSGMHGMSGPVPVCTANPMGDMSAGHATATGVMLAAHVVATVATALLLANGERLLTELPALLLARVTRWLGARVVPALPLRPAQPRTCVTGMLAGVAAGSARRRGPPRPAGVAVPA